MSTRIGFIGLGMMGQGMAANLLAKGYPLVGTAHRNRAPLEALEGRLNTMVGALIEAQAKLNGLLPD